jgi:antitoxin component of RelBE/YafQ-DinJ toxin-antitoxin module
MAVITARVDDNVKLGLQQFADEVGTTVGGLINMWATKILQTKHMTIGFSDEEREDQEMYAQRERLQKQFQKSVQSWRSSLVI